MAADDGRAAALASGRRPLLSDSPMTSGPRHDDARAGASYVPPLAFIDSHAHLASEDLAPDIDALMERLMAAGGEGVVCIGESLTAAARARSFAARFPSRLWFTAGVHPHDAAGFDPVRDTEAIASELAQGAVAVGECGLDYHYDHSPRALQRRAFAAQLALAAQHRRPVVVHTRDADDDTAAMVREAGEAGIRGVLHCYTGPLSLAETALAANWCISFSGIATFNKWERDDVIRAIPADRLLVESDSPYLAPVPHRGKRNEPAWCAYTLRRLAAVRGDEVTQLAPLVLANTRRLFALN